MKKVKVLKCMSKMKDLMLSEFAGHVVYSMDGNPNYPNPNPPLALVTSRRMLYDEALVNAHEGKRTDTANKIENRKKLEDTLQSLAGYVEENCQNNVTILLSSGFGMWEKSGNKATPDTPTNVQIKDGNLSGEIIVSFKKSKNAASSVVRYTEDMSTGNWKYSDPSTKSKIVIKGLTRGKEIWVQVKSINSHGSSEWSVPVVWLVR